MPARPRAGRAAAAVRGAGIRQEPSGPRACLCEAPRHSQKQPEVDCILSYRVISAGKRGSKQDGAAAARREVKVQEQGHGRPVREPAGTWGNASRQRGPPPTHTLNKPPSASCAARKVTQTPQVLHLGIPCRLVCEHTFFLLVRLPSQEDLIARRPCAGAEGSMLSRVTSQV